MCFSASSGVWFNLKRRIPPRLRRKSAPDELTDPHSQALLLVKPETVLGWHRHLFRLLWKRKSATRNRPSRVPTDTIALIRQMARDNRLWGAERIQGELRQLGVKLAKRTIQKYMRAVRPSRPRGQPWSTFLKNHAAQIWACDFLPVI